MDKASEAILALKPVSFYYKKELEPNGSKMFGLIAEDVEKVDPEIVTHDPKGAPETVRYDSVNALLLNEFLKEHRKIEAQESEIAELRVQLKSAVTQIEKVSAQLQAERIGATIASTEKQAFRVPRT